MITAHLPSGYVLSRFRGWSGPVMAAAVLGAVWPDIDLLFFYLVDNRAFHHHRYWVHAPAFALVVSLALIAAVRLLAPQMLHVSIAFATGWGLHILLDAPVGSLMWLWPFDDTLYAPFTVPATQTHWILSFVFHWSFVFELMIWFIASVLFLKQRGKQASQ